MWWFGLPGTGAIAPKDIKSALSLQAQPPGGLTGPDSRKALALKNSLEREVDKRYPASILQLHPACSLYLDQASAALLSAQVPNRQGK